MKNPLDNSVRFDSAEHDSQVEFSHDEQDPIVRRLALQMAADFLGNAMEWVCQGGKAKRSGVVIRTLALVWMTNPNLFGNQAELASCLGESRKVINTAVTSFRDEFGYALPSMRKDATRKKLSTIKTQFHAERNQAVGS